MKQKSAKLILVMLIGLVALAMPSWAAKDQGKRRIPVILDTDIGDDIDDTWALGLVLNSPELDLKLAVGDYGKPEYRAKILAKFLHRAGRSDVPVGVGIEVPSAKGRDSQIDWVRDYDLKSYPGKVHTNGVAALIDIIMKSPEPITLLAIGPLSNIEAALAQEPRIAQKAVFVGMHGSVRKGYGGKAKIDPEWNVKVAPKACQVAFQAPWKKTITPLDTCGLIVLDGAQFQQIRKSKNAVAGDILTNYRLWTSDRKGYEGEAVDTHSSTLFDCVAVYLAVAEELCTIESLGLKVTDDGFTLIDQQAPVCRVATEWKDQQAFEDWLVRRISQ
jgi:inosine-uridine nucleoside N-ribohydrolase